MRLAINGIQLNVETYGVGSPLLLLHGFTGSAATWEPFFASWGRHFHLLAVDVIGHGRSDAPRDAARYDMDLAAADLVAVLDHFGYSRAHVLGYSMGGRLALTFAVRYPQRVQALLLEGSSPGLAAAAEREARFQRDDRLAAAIERDGIEAFVDRWESLPLFRSQQRLPKAVRARLREQRLQNDVIGLAGSLRGMGTGAQRPLWEELPQLQMPLKCVVGALDDKFRLIAAEIAARVLGAEVEVVAEAGHTVHVEQPSIFDTIVLDFFREVEKK